MLATFEKAGRTRLLIAAIAIAVLAAVPRLAVALADPVPFLMSGDSGTYVMGAFSWYPGPDRPLGYSIFLSAVFAFIEDLSWVVAAQAALGVLSTVGFAWLGARFVFSSTAGCIVFACLASLDVTVLLYERWIVSESLSIALLVPHFYCLFRLVVDDRGRFAVATGFTIGVLMLVRNVFVFCIPVTAVTLLLDDIIGPRRRSTLGWFAIALGLSVGLAIPLTLYDQHHRFRTGHAGTTHFDGFSLWHTAGHPAICDRTPWSLAKKVICTSEAAENNDLRAFRGIWGENAPSRTLERRIGSRVDTNSALRRIAIESILVRPVEYALATVHRLYDILFGPETFTRRDRISPWLVESIGGRWGPDTLSLHAPNATIWDFLHPMTRINIFYGAVLVGFTIWALRTRWREIVGSTLMLWIWGYLLLCALSSPASSRFRVIVAIPILMLVVLAGERLAGRLLRSTGGASVPFTPVT